MFETIGEVEFDKSLEQLNTLYQKGFITKPYYKFPEDKQTKSERICWFFIDSLESFDGYKSRGIGQGITKADAKIQAAYDILRFMLYDDE